MPRSMVKETAEIAAALLAAEGNMFKAAEALGCSLTKVRNHVARVGGYYKPQQSPKKRKRGPQNWLRPCREDTEQGWLRRGDDLKW
jgi:hypothetical protein